MRMYVLLIEYRCHFFSSRRRHTRLQGDWSSDVCSSDLVHACEPGKILHRTAQLARKYTGNWRHAHRALKSDPARGVGATYHHRHDAVAALTQWTRSHTGILGLFNLLEFRAVLVDDHRITRVRMTLLVRGELEPFGQ